MKKLILSIGGMTCSACSNGLEKYLNKQEGIKASVNLVMENASIEYDETLLNQQQIETYIKEAGFESLGVYQVQSVVYQRKKEKRTVILYTILMILFMYISMGSMIGLPEVFDKNQFPKAYTVVLCFFSFLFLGYGFDILKNGFKNMFHKTPNMDTLVSISVLSSMTYSIIAMIQVFLGHTHFMHSLYFESAAMVLYFIKLGRYIDHLSKSKTREAIEGLVQITPNHATIKREDQLIEVTLDEIKKGDLVICKPGDKIAVDGIVVSGSTHVDESFLTGESKPSKKALKDTVIAGSINLDGYIEYQAVKIGKDSTISEIVRLVVEATNTKAPIARVADKVSGYFTYGVLLLSVLTLLGYLLFGFSFSEALQPFITVLVVACPCSLGLATPLALVVSVGLCAEHGILIKRSEVLEIASHIDTVVFDKTGTLTYGELKIAQSYYIEDIDHKNVLTFVGSLENKSNHPIRHAFLTEVEKQNLELLPVEDFQNLSGYGLVGMIDHHQVMVGNQQLLKKYHIKNTLNEKEEELKKDGNTLVYVVKDSEVLALFGIDDVVREHTKEIIKRFHDQHIETVMLTGDHKFAAEKIAKELNIDRVIAEVRPKEKARTIQSLKKNKKQVMMVGDGVNDSPALACSDLGVSLHSGTDIALDSADVILTRNDLGSILDFISISKKTIRNMKQNLFWAFFYNTLMIPVAIGFLKPIGLSINPMIASIAMVCSSLTVVLNALRLKTIL